MKRYAVFAGSNYYPAGGWDDFVGSADTKEEALELLADRRQDWYQIVDLTTGARVA